MALRTSNLRTLPVPRVDVRLLVGLALMAAAVAGGLSLWSQMRVTEPVVVAARTIPAGHVLTAGDLTVTQARLEGPLATLAIGEAELGSIVGQTATAPIHAGALVVRPGVGSGPVIGADEVAVTVPVPADAIFGKLRRGDHVAVMATSDQGKPQSLTSTLLQRATVYDVAVEASRVSIGGGNQDEDGRISNVTLLIPRAEAERVTHALVNGKLTLLLVAPDPPAEPAR